MIRINKTMFRSKFVAATLALALTASVQMTPVLASEGVELKHQEWSFEGIFGVYDRGALQRGYQVYTEVCAACHSLNLLSYRNLSQTGGPEFTKEQVKVLAAEFEVEADPDEEGEVKMRPALASDKFVSPYANENAGRAANGGALPPDLSLIIKARKNGANYLYSLMTGYEEEAPAGFDLREGMNYNHFFAGNQIAMPAPIADEGVEYTDGTKPTVENQARDVVTFLAWASEPHMEARKKLGFKVLIYLIILAGLLYATTKKMWSRTKH